MAWKDPLCPKMPWMLDPGISWCEPIPAQDRTSIMPAIQAGGLALLHRRMAGLP